MSGLSALFIPNEERLRKMCGQLSQRDVKPEKRLRSIVSDIKRLDLYRWDAGEEVQLETVLGTGRVVLQTYLETNPQLSKETDTLIKAVLQQGQTTPTLEMLHQFEHLAGSMRSMDVPLEPEALFWIVLSFLDYVVSSTFLTKAWEEWQAHQKTMVQDDSAAKAASDFSSS